jgi:hypothetical protein
MRNLLQRVYEPGKSSLELTAQFAVVGLEAAKRLLRLQARTVSRSFLESTEIWGNLLAGRDSSMLLQIYQCNLNTLDEARNASAEILADAQTRLFEILNQQITAHRDAVARSLEYVEQSARAESAAVLRAVDSTPNDADGEALAQMAKRQA